MARKRRRTRETSDHRSSVDRKGRAGGLRPVGLKAMGIWTADLRRVLRAGGRISLANQAGTDNDSGFCRFHYQYLYVARLEKDGYGGYAAWPGAERKTKSNAR